MRQTIGPVLALSTSAAQGRIEDTSAAQGRSNTGAAKGRVNRGAWAALRGTGAAVPGHMCWSTAPAKLATVLNTMA